VGACLLRRPLLQQLPTACGMLLWLSACGHPPRAHHRWCSCCCLSVAVLLVQTYIRNEGVKQLSYAADGVSPVAGGDSTQQLEHEMEAASARR
jgi:hypothetical protein